MSVKNVLLDESARFLELCQSYLCQGKIDLYNYQCLTNVKLNFIKELLQSEDADSFCMDFGLKQRLEKVFFNEENFLSPENLN